jgi:hypothetical protein
MRHRFPAAIARRIRRAADGQKGVQYPGSSAVVSDGHHELDHRAVLRSSLCGCVMADGPDRGERFTGVVQPGHHADAGKRVMRVLRVDSGDSSAYIGGIFIGVIRHRLRSRIVRRGAMYRAPLLGPRSKQSPASIPVFAAASRSAPCRSERSGRSQPRPRACLPRPHLNAQRNGRHDDWPPVVAGCCRPVRVARDSTPCDNREALSPGLRCRHLPTSAPRDPCRAGPRSAYQAAPNPFVLDALSKVSARHGRLP